MGPTGARMARQVHNTPQTDAAPLVFLLHGICRTGLGMFPMRRALQKRGYEVVNWTYPSRKYTMEQLADRLARLVEPYAGRTKHFVTHSMGGILVRLYLQRCPPPNLGRFVMIGPPNQGAFLADKLAPWWLYRRIFGPAGLQLRRGIAGSCADAGIPPCEFGIIAGGKGNSRGINRYIPGDNDGTVEVDGTRLDGAADFLILPHIHTWIHMMPATVRNTLHFLETGRFLGR
jgi:triacylglycerol lipase